MYIIYLKDIFTRVEHLNQQKMWLVISVQEK